MFAKTKLLGSRPATTLLIFAFSLLNIQPGQLLFCSAQKTDPFTIDLFHRLSSDQDFKLRGSILVRPKTEYRAASASIIEQARLSDSDLKALSEASARGDTYYLRASARRGSKTSPTPIKTTQTLIKACSLYSSNLEDFLAINLGPTNNFINVNLFTSNPECSDSRLQFEKPNTEFNTTVLVEYGSTGPLPDTATYIRRLEEERQNKLKEGKGDNRSFILKYWMYIVPAVVFLMVFSGPADQAR